MSRYKSLGGALIVTLAAGMSLQAFAQLKAIELAVEARADSAVLPSGPSSTLVVTPCTGCKPLALPASERSRYFVGHELVSLTEFRRQMATRPTAMLVIFYRKETNELSRVVASAP